MARLKIKTQISPTVWKLVTNALEEEEVGVYCCVSPGTGLQHQGPALSSGAANV